MSAEAELDAVAQLRKPPHSTEAEQSLLGGLLLDNRAFDRVGDMLTTEAFYSFEHRLIYGAIVSLLVANKPADVVTVGEVLKKDGSTGGDKVDLRYLAALPLSVPSASNARRYAEIVVDRALERRLIATADEVATSVFSGPGSAAEKLEAAASKFRALEGGNMTGAPRPLSELLIERLDHVTDLHQTGEESAAWATPLPALNRLLAGGMRPGRVYVLAARPSVGKSALAQALALQFAKQDLPVLFLSQEMPSSELVDRIIAGLGRVDFGHLQTATLDDDEWSAISKAVELGARLPFYVDDQPSLTLGQIRAKARQVRGLKVLVVDYLQLSAGTSTGDRFTNRNAEIEEVSRGLKSLAKDLGIAVILLSQLNREVEKRPGKKPMLSDLRDSGAIEQDADVVILLWPIEYVANDGVSMLGVQVAKNRGGAKGDFPLCFWGRHMRFGEAELPMTHYTSKPVGASGASYSE